MIKKTRFTFFKSKFNVYNTCNISDVVPPCLFNKLAIMEC